jgi:hypothetical protein
MARSRWLLPSRLPVKPRISGAAKVSLRTGGGRSDQPGRDRNAMEISRRARRDWRHSPGDGAVLRPLQSIASDRGCEFLMVANYFQISSHCSFARNTRNWAMSAAFFLSHAQPASLRRACNTCLCPDSIKPEPMGSFLDNAFG